MKLSRQDKQESGCTGLDTAEMSECLQIKRKYIESHEFKTLTFRHEASPRTKNSIVSSRPFNRCLVYLLHCIRLFTFLCIHCKMSIEILYILLQQL